MSYKLDKPYIENDYYEFIAEHNHRNGREIQETETAVYALEADEIMQNGQPAKNPTYESELAEKQKAQRILEIKEELNHLDLKSIRAMREGGATKSGENYLDIYQTEINTLREELNTLEA